MSNVDLRVRRGEIHALIGPNGAGKTTFFNLLTKFLIPDRGQILYRGKDITFEKPAEVARRGIVRSFQVSAVFPHLTVLENVRIALQRSLATTFHFWKHESSLAVLNARVMELLEQVDLRRLRGHARGRAALRAQARARDRHHAGDDSRADAAGRADPGHGTRGRRPGDQRSSSRRRQIAPC